MITWDSFLVSFCPFLHHGIKFSLFDALRAAWSRGCRSSPPPTRWRRRQRRRYPKCWNVVLKSKEFDDITSIRDTTNYNPDMFPNSIKRARLNNIFLRCCQRDQHLFDNYPWNKFWERQAHSPSAEVETRKHRSKEPAVFPLLHKSLLSRGKCVEKVSPHRW